MATKNIEKIITVTSKGQITLPVSWRKSSQAKQILLEVKGEKIEITPINLINRSNSEYTVFDAIRDNRGKGLKAKDLIRILKKIDV